MLINHTGAQVRAGGVELEQKNSKKPFRFDAVNQPLQHSTTTSLYSHINQHSVQHALQSVLTVAEFITDSCPAWKASMGKEAETSNCKMSDT